MRPALRRRSFLAGSAVTAAAAAAVGAAYASRVSTVSTVDAGPRRAPLDAAAIDHKTDYDYIVVGSGAGGGPLAVRLAEAGFEVLVLEAGPAKTDADVYEVPAFHLFSSSDPEMSWDFYVRHYSDRALHGDAFVDAEDGVLYPRAATIGGCTSHHAMLMLAPENDDWDRIARITGDSEWNALGMAKYQQRVREWLPIETSPASLLAKDPVLARIVAGAVADTAGLAPAASNVDLVHGTIGGTLADPNDPAGIEAYREGAFLVPQSTRDGKRFGTRERLLEAAPRLRGFLHFQADTLAERLIFEQTPGRAPRATGLDVLVAPYAYAASPEQRTLTAAQRTAARRTITARREIIVSAGAFNTPQLLMLSGVGPAGHLRDHGITPIVDLPGLGGNLQDRYEMSVVTEYDRPFSILDGITYGARRDPGLTQWRSGDPNALYRSNGILIGIKEKVKGGSDHPELFVFGAPSNFSGYRPDFAAKGLAGGDHFTWAVVRGYAASQIGTVRLRSSDPTETPAINFGYFGDGRGGASSDHDLAAVREGIARARSMNDAAGRLRFGDGATDVETFPGPDCASAHDLDEKIRRDAWGHHASCTAPMGRDDDPLAVLDSKFRLRGTANVRVVDASVFPKIPALFPLMTLFAVSERAAVEIIADAERAGTSRQDTTR